MATISDLRAHVFAARDYAHIKHHATTSFAQHMALDAFYNATPGKIDDIVEIYQGAFGLIAETLPEVPDPDEGAVANIADYLSREVRWIQSVRKEIAQGITPIENLIDDLMALYLKTIYKLVNLK